MTFWRCYYHVIWATKNRQPLISPEIEKVIFQSAADKSAMLDSSILAINSVPDHVHVAVCIPPKIAIAEWVRNVKGITAHDVNTNFPDQQDSIKWQRGYGVLTFGAKTLPTVTKYIDAQKERHIQGLLEPYLERVEDE